MLWRLRSTLASLVFLKEEEVLSAAHSMAPLVPMAMALMVLFVAFPLMAGDLLQRMGVGAVMLLAWAAVGWLLHQGRARLASLTFVAGTWGVATYCVITRGGVRSPAYLIYLVLITYASFVVTPAAALVMFAVSLLVGLGAVLAAQAGVLPVPSVVHTPITLYASYSACMLMVILVVLKVTAAYRDAFGKLRASEERFRSLVEATSDWIWEVDPTGAYTYASPKVRDLLGWEPAEVLGRTPYDLMPPEEARRVATVVGPFLESGQPFSHLENTNLHRDGHEVVLETSGVPVFDGRGGFRGFRGIDRDVTEQRRAEEALRESEEKHRALFEMLPVSATIHQNRRLVLANPACVAMVRAPDAGSVVGEEITRYVGEGARAQVEAHLQTEGQVGPEAPVHFFTTLRRMDGEEFPAEIFATDILYQGQPATQVVALDITAIVEQQDRLLAAERARADLAQHLNAEINHRARNNLAMIAGLLQMQALQEPDSELAARLREAVSRMRSFVDIHEKIYATGAEEADLLEVIQQVAGTLRTVFSGTAAEFTVQGASGLLPTRAVTNLAVLTNELMTNALKHGGAGAGRAVEVIVHLDRAEGRVRISVWNSGPPLPDGFDVAAQKGMGLRLVTTFAEQYGGSFSMRPAEGGTVAELVVEEAALD